MVRESKPLLDISEVDACARNMVDGDALKVTNQRGKVLLTAHIRKRVRPGVVCMPQGF